MIKVIGGYMYCDVLIELSSFNIDKTFTYKVPSNTKILVGSRVLVPFSNQKLEGFVLNIKDNIDDIDYEVKEIIDVIDQEPILNEELLSLGKTLSDKTVSTLISCYQVMLPKALKANHKVKIVMDDLYEEKDDEEESEFDVEKEEPTEEDEFNSIDDEDDYAEDDLADLTILNEDQLEDSE